MPFDERSLSANGPEAVLRANRFVAGWLFAVCFMIWVMIVLGGATRLTGSGLSIMEWAPLHGVLPPMSEAEWQRLYGLYQQIPQYELLNKGFGLAGFKQIFWLEWTHRLWGRLIGLVFLVPLLVFWARGMIGRAMVPRLALLFVLGGLQGAVGWFMVASGFFPDSTAVSPYRLVVHLALALVLFAAILWTGLSLLPPRRAAPPAPAWLRRLLAGCVAFVTLTILAGGFVAGLHAGLDYNTFPLMDGRLVPEGYAMLDPFWLNLTENVAAVQFDHRLLATATALLCLATAALGLRAGVRTGALLALAALVLVQYGLGVATLLAVVPPALATAHQAVAVLVLTAALAAVHSARPFRQPLAIREEPS
jgi:heme a synthase